MFASYSMCLAKRVHRWFGSQGIWSGNETSTLSNTGIENVHAIELISKNLLLFCSLTTQASKFAAVRTYDYNFSIHHLAKLGEVCFQCVCRKKKPLHTMTGDGSVALFFHSPLQVVQCKRDTNSCLGSLVDIVQCLRRYF